MYVCCISAHCHELKGIPVESLAVTDWWGCSLMAGSSRAGVECGAAANWIMNYWENDCLVVSIARHMTTGRLRLRQQASSTRSDWACTLVGWGLYCSSLYWECFVDDGHIEWVVCWWCTTTKPSLSKETVLYCIRPVLMNTFEALSLIQNLYSLNNTI